MKKLISEKRLADIIYSARKGLGMTQVEMSKKTKITQGTLSKIESNISSISAKHWFLLSDLLEIPSDCIQFFYLDRRKKLKASGAKTNHFKIPRSYWQNAYSSVREVLPFVLYIEDKFGVEELEKFLKIKKIHPTYFVDLGNIINPVFVKHLLEHFLNINHIDKELTPELLRDIAKYNLQLNIHGFLGEEYDKKGSATRIIKHYIACLHFYESLYKVENLLSTPKEISFEQAPQIEFRYLATEEINTLENIIIPYRRHLMETLGNCFENLEIKITSQFDPSSGKVSYLINFI